MAARSLVFELGLEGAIDETMVKGNDRLARCPAKFPRIHVADLEAPHSQRSSRADGLVVCFRQCLDDLAHDPGH